MIKRISKIISNINSLTFKPLFRRMIGWSEIQEQVDTAYYFLDNFLEIEKAPKATGKLRELQLVATEVLRIVLTILERNDIDCWLDYGTLLGAVRHKGFIPWDDDLDVAIKRKDYDKTIKVLQKELPQYGIEVGKPTLGRIWVCIWNAGVVLDIFPMDNVCLKSVKDHEELSKKVFKYRRYYTHHRDKSEAKLTIKREQIIGKPDDDNPLYYHNAEFNADGSVYDYSTIFPLRKIEFEGYSFFAPNNYSLYLPQKYGNHYLSFPKNGILHHSGGDNPIYLNSEKHGIDMNKLLEKLKSYHPN